MSRIVPHKIRRKQMKYEIQRGGTIYVLKLNAKELQYLAHLIDNDNCTCEAVYCEDGDMRMPEIREIAREEGLEY
jgi:hypothetical protein